MATYSISAGLASVLSGDRSTGGLELEISDELAKKYKRTVGASTLLIPTNVRMPMQRDLTAGAGTGVNLIGTDHRGDLFIQYLYNLMVLKALGATLLDDLKGPIDIPKQIGRAAASWGGENVAAVESEMSFGKVSLAPKRLSTFTEVSKRLIRESNPAADMLIMNDLSEVIALAVDAAAIYGTGVGDEPTGIINMAGVGSVEGGVNGGVPDWSDIVALESLVDMQNALIENTAYLTNTTIKGALKITEKTSGTSGAFIWPEGAVGAQSSMNGHRVTATNQVPNDLVKGTSTDCSAIIFGNWKDVMIGNFGPVEMQINPFALDKEGMYRIVVDQEADVQARRAQSFSVMRDALPVPA